jgi:arabinose-5-phosphate isomerase
MGDALAVSLLELKGFTDRDFAKYHPGGALGKKLYLRVKDITSQNAKPQVNATSNLREVIVAITENRLGMTAVLESNILVGIITDGDLRRMLSSGKDIDSLVASDIMSVNPKTVNVDMLAVVAREVLEEFNVSQLVALENGQYAGVVHVHDLIREGIL